MEAATHFRMPGTAREGVRLRRLAGVSLWGAVLGFGGLIIALRIVFGLFTTIPGWYVPAIFLLGLVGLVATVGAFSSLHHDRLPWLLLGGASIAEGAGYLVTIAT